MTISTAYLVASLLGQGWTPQAAQEITSACPTIIHSEWVGFNGTVYGPPCWIYADLPEPQAWVVAHESLHAWTHRHGVTDDELTRFCVQVLESRACTQDLEHIPHRILASVDGQVSRLPPQIRGRLFGWSQHSYRMVLPLVRR